MTFSRTKDPDRADVCHCGRKGRYRFDHDHPGRARVTIHNQLLAAVGTTRGTDAANRLCQACVDLLDVDGAAISLVFDGASQTTLGASSGRAREYDEVQFVLGEGPCLESVSTRVVVDADLADPEDARWPAYSSAMLGHELRWVHAVPVTVAGQYIGALDLFRTTPSPLHNEARLGALAAAELAELPVLDLLDTDLRAAVSDPTSEAWAELHLLSRAEVSQATGMLVAQLDVDTTEALVRLRAHAYALNRSATDVARDIIDRRLRLDEQ